MSEKFNNKIASEFKGWHDATMEELTEYAEYKALSDVLEKLSLPTLKDYLDKILEEYERENEENE